MVPIFLLLSCPVACPSTTLPSWPAVWQQHSWQWLHLLLPQAAPEVLASKLLGSLYTRGKMASTILIHPVGKTQGNQLLKEGKAAKWQGEGLEGQRLHFCGFAWHNRGTLASSQTP